MTRDVSPCRPCVWAEGQGDSRGERGQGVFTSDMVPLRTILNSVLILTSASILPDTAIELEHRVDAAAAGTLGCAHFSAGPLHFSDAAHDDAHPALGNAGVATRSNLTNESFQGAPLATTAAKNQHRGGFSQASKQEEEQEEQDSLSSRPSANSISDNGFGYIGDYIGVLSRFETNRPFYASVRPPINNRNAARGPTVNIDDYGNYNVSPTPTQRRSL